MAGATGGSDGGLIIDVQNRRFNPVAFCPGYARGLGFTGTHAIVGQLLARDNRTFRGLPLDGALQKNRADARCGLLVINTATGNSDAWVRIEGVVQELMT